MIKIHLAHLLSQRSMSQAQLSREAKIRAATINEYYHDEAKRINLTYISKICAVLDCEVGDLLEYVPEDER